MLNHDSIQNMTSQEIYNSLQKDLNKVFKKYYSLVLSEDKFQEFVLSEIDKTHIHYHYELDYGEFICALVKEKGIQRVKRLLEDPNYSDKIINRFIEQNFKNNVNYKEANTSINRLNRFIEIYQFFPTYEMLSDLLAKNKKLQESVEVIFKENQTAIVNGNSDDVFNNPFIISLLEIYASSHGIEIKEESIDDLLKIDSEESSPKKSQEEDEEGNEDDDKKEVEDFLHTNAYQAYIQDIRGHPLLTLEEEKKYGYILKYSDPNSLEYQEAKSKFVNGNLRLVISIAKRYLGRGLLFMDLIQEGNLGLLTAIDRFDIEKGNKFSTYATWWIRQAVTRAVADKGRTIRLPVHVVEELGKYNRRVSALKAELGRDPTEEEIIEQLGYSKKKIDYYNKIMPDTSSLNDFIGDDEESERMDFVVVDKNTVEEQALQTAISRDLLALLNKVFDERTVYVLKRRFGFDGKKPETLETIGKDLNVTRERVRQIEAKAIRKIKNSQRLAETFASFTDSPDQALSRIGKKSTKIVIKYEEEKKEMKLHTIYEYLSNYSKEAIDSVIETLSDREKELLRIRYGENLSSPVQKPLTKEEYNKFYGALIPKIKRLLSKTSGESAPKVIKPNEERKQEQVISSEPNPSVEPVAEQTTSQENPQESVAVVDKTLQTNAPLKSVEMPALETSITKGDAVKLLELLRSPSYHELTNTFSSKDAIIVGLKLGYVDGKCFTTESVSQFLGVSEEEVRESTLRVLSFYRDNLLGVVDSIIGIATDQPKQYVIKKPENEEV